MDRVLQNELKECIQSLNSIKLRELLDSDAFQDYDQLDGCFLHEVAKTFNSKSEEYSSRSEIIFMLANAGFPVNCKDQAGLTPLHYAVRFNDAKSCRFLLQCGADMHEKANSDLSILDEVLYTDDVSNEVVCIFENFQPGLWEAVRTGDVKATRRLVNLWCRTDLKKDGKDLKELALDSGIEGIIGLILNVEPSMKLVHHLLAGDKKNAHRLLDTSPQHINFNFRNLNERGAPILYYAIQKQVPDIIRKMRQHDCRLYSIMLDEYGNDMPVFFTCLNSNVCKEVVASLLHGKDIENILARILYKGKSVVEVAIDFDVPLDAFDILIQFGGPVVVASRNKADETPREYAIKVGKNGYADIIDQNVALWTNYPDEYHGKCQFLALSGYTEFVHDGNAKQKRFLKFLPQYQNQMVRLCEAIESGDVELFENFMFYTKEGSEIFNCDLFWQGRCPGEGLPVLHRAVLWQRKEIIELIFRHKSKNESIDNLLDQYHRTAIHYALGLRNASDVVSLLMDQGCSEHTLDKNGKEPLDFKLKRNTLEMSELMSRLKQKDFKSLEPEPWNVPCHKDTSQRNFPMRFYHSHNHSHNHSHSPAYVNNSYNRDTVPVTVCNLL